MKRCITFALVFVLLFSLSSPAFAIGVNDGSFNNATVTVDDLVASGYTLQNAQRLLEFDRIMKKMEAFGQIIDLDSNEDIYIAPDKFGINHLEPYEEALLKTMLREHLQEQNTATRSRRAAYSELIQEMEENPGQNSYTVQIGNNSYLRATTKIIDTYFSDGSTRSSSGPILQDQYQFFDYGYKDIYYELEEFAGVYYAKCQIQGRATSTPTAMTLTKLDSAQASIGLISIQNAGLNVMQDIATVTGDYCQASNNVVFAISGSVGVTLKGVISITVNAGSNWTQKAIIRAHKTSAWGIAWTLADVYAI